MLHFWKLERCEYQTRYRIFTFAWGNGNSPVAGSKKYFGYKLTFAFSPVLFRFKCYFREFRLHFLGVEAHYRGY